MENDIDNAKIDEESKQKVNLIITGAKGCRKISTLNVIN